MSGASDVGTAHTVWVTRPEVAGMAWVQGLRQAGFDARSLPLLRLAPESDIKPIQKTWSRLGDYSAVMLVSAAAVRYFFQACPESINPADFVSGLRWWVPGEGTRNALLAQGVLATQLDAPDPKLGHFDSESLWLQVQTQVQVGKKYLLVCGAAADGSAQGREHLAQTLVRCGAQVDTLSVYRRWPLAPATLSRSGIWLFSSGLSLQALKKDGWKNATALCTHARIAALAATLEFDQVLITQPQLTHIVDTLRNLGRFVA